MIRISWSAVTCGDNYRVRRATNSIFTTGVTTLTSTDDGTPFDDTTGVDGTEYFYRIQVQNEDGNFNAEGTSSAGIVAQDIPAAPSAPIVTATAVEQLTVDKPSNPPQAGLIDWKIYDDTDSYVAVQATRTLAQTDWDDTGMGDGTSRQYKVAFRNLAGIGAQSPASIVNTTWDVPDAETVAPTVTNTVPSRLRIITDKPFPDDNGSAITHVQFWRSATEFGTYSDVSGDVVPAGSLALYDDWSVNGGETWWYKVIYKNAVGYSALGTAAASGLALTPVITKTSNLIIRVADNLLTKPSNLRVNATETITKTSNLAIAGTELITKTSNLVIRVADNLLTKATNLRINATQLVTKASNIAVKVFGLSLTKTSNLRILINPDTPSTPTCVFDSYELNASSGSIARVSGGLRDVSGLSSPNNLTEATKSLHVC